MPAYPLSAPPITPSTEALKLKQQYNFAESPYSGAQVSTTTGYTSWQVALGFPAVTEAQFKQFAAWVNSLRGPRGSFTYRPIKSGIAVTGKTLANIAYVATNIINVGGWSGTQASGLNAGDYFTMNGQFFQITSAPANSTAGVCTIEFEPFLRKQTAATTPINFATPSITLRLASSGDDMPTFSRDIDGLYLPNLNCVEAR